VRYVANIALAVFPLHLCSIDHEVFKLVGKAKRTRHEVDSEDLKLASFI
jgi:hypothetical protein